jgi:formate--tetrahydrofolate ligase
MHDSPPSPPRPIQDIANGLGLRDNELIPYGRLKAKLDLGVLERREGSARGKLLLVTAITPTPAGEGKTTVSIGLAQALCRLGCRAIAALREPSLGPVFGMKGGGTGGGAAQLVPADDINLHFTGDLDAVSAANNLLAALVDNHLHWGNTLGLDPDFVTWRRCLDSNDRALRRISIPAGDDESAARETGFDITAASEVMAVLCLASGYEDLSARLDRLVVGRTLAGEAVTASRLGGAGAMAALLKDALCPNLVQTLEGTPVIVHGGPFGNIAHGCSSVLGTRMALALGDVCVTEAGFGADLGAEKFLDIKCRQSGLRPDGAVLVATVRALKLHGGVKLRDLQRENVGALEAGFPNLRRHADNLRKLGIEPVVGINRFAADTELELRTLLRLCDGEGLRAAEADVWREGGRGAENLAAAVLSALEKPGLPQLLYRDDLSLRGKIEAVAREIYRAGRVDFLPDAAEALDCLERDSFGRLPVCLAKTQYSFSDDPSLRGAPEGHILTIREVRLSAGAGFVVAFAGGIVSMPGLPRRPAAERIRLTPTGEITGLA